MSNNKEVEAKEGLTLTQMGVVNQTITMHQAKIQRKREELRQDFIRLVKLAKEEVEAYERSEAIAQQNNIACHGDYPFSVDTILITVQKMQKVQAQIVDLESRIELVQTFAHTLNNAK